MDAEEVQLLDESDLDLHADIMAKNLWLSVERARTLLGWSPIQPSVLDDLTIGSYAAG